MKLLRRGSHGVVAPLLLLLLPDAHAPAAASGSATQAAAGAERSMVVARDVMVPMRDGVRLACDVYLPGRGAAALAGKYPVVLERTPYGKGDSGWPKDFVRHGYAAVVQDTRGRFASEGRFHAMRDDVADGYDTAQWIGAQPWCDGHIGTVGTSYPGGTQHSLAISGAPYLSAMVPIDAASNTGRWGLRHDGAFEMRFLNWVFNIAGPEGSRESTDPATRAALEQLGASVREYAKGMPLRRGMTPLKLLPDYEDWLITIMTHSDYDQYWRDSGISVIDHIAEYKDVPVYHVTGWYDSWSGPVANLSYPRLRQAKKSLQRLLIGPWVHGGQEQSFAGEAEFGPAAAIDWLDLHLRWFGRWLKGEQNGVDRERPVRIFVMGGGDGHRTPEGRIFVGGAWRDEDEWPLTRAIDTSYYLHADGSLGPLRPLAGEPTRYQADPAHPVPTLGGNISSAGPLEQNGAMDQRCRPTLWACEDSRPLSARRDVVVFETPPLAEDREVTGRLIVQLYVSSSAPDTDFTAKLIDVYPPSADFPAGFDLNIGDGITRARYRDSLAKPAPLFPGRVYPLTVEMYPTSVLFKKGHRIRLDVASSNFPRFDVNPNTGEPLGLNRRTAIAENAIWHDPRHPSRLVLPIVPPAPGL